MKAEFVANDATVASSSRKNLQTGAAKRPAIIAALPE